jgi:hypothetical protein
VFDNFRSAVFNRQRLKWEKKRKHGKRSFLLYRGVLKWGGIILTTITNVLARHKTLTWILVVSTLIACLFAGYVWARCVWVLNERRFSGAGKQQDSIKES